MNDDAERNAFGRIFRAGGRPILFATKPNLSYSLGATGAIEAVATILALREQEVPPVRGLDMEVPMFPIPICVGKPAKLKATYGLSLTLGFGGFDTCLIFQRYDESNDTCIR